MAASVALTSALVVPRASADQISDLRAQASDLASRIQTLGRQEAALGEQYDADQLAVQALQAKVGQAQNRLAAADSHATKARTALQADAINAYVHGGNNPLTSGGNAVSDATNTLLRAEYVNSLATNQSDAIDQYRLAAVQDQAAKANLQQQTSAAQAEVQQVGRDRQAAQATQNQLQGVLNRDTGQIAVLVAQQQAAAAAAAAAAAQAKLQAERLAQQQAQAAAAAAAARQVSAPAPASGSNGNANVPQPPASLTSSPAPPVGSGASGAVAAAESRVGAPYVWGAAGPDAFDCSGLVMWAYAQVGISLPHFSGAQYADTTHISMADLQPGDLVFPSDPGQHVAMYVGGGDIVEAPYTGATVHVVPMGSWFVLASRVA